MSAAARKRAKLRAIARAKVRALARAARRPAHLPPLRPIHRKILERRTELDLTQHELAVRCDVDKTAVSHWENGFTAPTNERIPIVAEALRLTIDELYDEAL